jgi:hypothetical protein
MKNWKQFTFVAIIAIVGIIIGFMACDNDNSTTHIHDWGEWIETKAPTATEEGQETKTCKTDPSHMETRPISPLAAPFFGTWDTNDGRVLTINANNLRFDVTNDYSYEENRGNYWVIGQLNWISATNNNSATKNDYPNGYIISGQRINSNYLTIGENWRQSFFLNNDSKSICLVLDNTVTGSATLKFYKK